MIAIERYQSLVAGADARLRALGVANAGVVVGDGLAVPAEAGPFDRILVHGFLPEVPERLVQVLVEGGVLVAGRPSAEGQAVARLVRQAARTVEAPVFSGPAQAPLVPGIAATL